MNNNKTLTISHLNKDCLTNNNSLSKSNLSKSNMYEQKYKNNVCKYKESKERDDT